MSAAHKDEVYRQKRQELLDLISSMGFPPKYAAEAVSQVDPTLPSAAELCFHWIEENPMKNEEEDDGVDELTAGLMSMGFPEADSRKALKSANNDVQRAVCFLLADRTKELRRAIDEEQAEYERVTGGGPDETGATTPLDDDEVLIKQEVKQDDIKPVSEISKMEIKQLTEQLVKLQDLVLTYQNKYLALKRKVTSVKKKKGIADEDEEDEDGPAKGRQNTPNDVDVDALIGLDPKIKEASQAKVKKTHVSQSLPNPKSKKDDEDDAPPPLMYGVSVKRNSMTGSLPRK